MSWTAPVRHHVAVGPEATSRRPETRGFFRPPRVVKGREDVSTVDFAPQTLRTLVFDSRLLRVYESWSLGDQNS